jgi:2-polyprenyl-3-methyl-5-hydroxy-6-metoxy-1,4-benzoquinol methylase
MEKNDVVVLCSLCQSNNVLKKFNKEGIGYYYCNSCGFLFSKPSVNANSQENINEYEDYYIKYFDSHIADKKNFDSILSWISKKVDFRGKTMLDVGCGSGKLVDYLREKGFNIKGIEYSKPLFKEYLKDKKYFFNCSIDEYSKIDNGPYDVITLMDVLEHVDYPAKIIEDISKVQPEGGFLVIEIPLYKSIPSMVFGRNWHFFHKYHLSYFTKKRLTKLLKNNGYDLVQWKFRGKYVHVSFLLKYFANMFLRKSNLPLPAFMEKLCIYVNPCDIFVGCFKKSTSNF